MGSSPSKNLAGIVSGIFCVKESIGPTTSRVQTVPLRLKFRDVQWFPENTPLFSIFEQGETVWKDFGLRMQAFTGDVRSVDTGHPEDGVVIMPNYANTSSQFAFLSALKNEDGTNAKNPLDRMFQGLFQRLERGNKFISEHSKALKVDSKRIKSIENDKMSAVYSIAMLEKSFRVFYIKRSP